MSTDALDEIKDLESSSESKLDAAPEGADAESSPATGDIAANDTESIVRNVVDEARSAAATASPTEGLETGQKPGGSAKTPDDENYSDVPFHKHPRFQHLFKRMRAAEGDAGEFRTVRRFLDDNGLAPAEAADALVVAGLLKSNPVEAWKRMEPIVRSLLSVVGEVLPEDLASRVRAGQISQDAALEVSKARAYAQSVAHSQAVEQQRMSRRMAQEQGSLLVGTAEAWEADRRTRDPHFEAKLPQITEVLKAIQYDEGKPNSPQGVQGQLQRAYEAVNARFQPPAPSIRTVNRPAMRPVTGGQVAGTAQAAPDDTLGIIRNIRRQRQA